MFRIAAGLFSKLAERGIGVEMIIQSVMRGGVNDIAFLVKEALLGGHRGLQRLYAQKLMLRVLPMIRRLGGIGCRNWPVGIS